MNGLPLGRKHSLHLWLRYPSIIPASLHGSGGVMPVPLHNGTVQRYRAGAGIRYVERPAGNCINPVHQFD